MTSVNASALLAERAVPAEPEALSAARADAIATSFSRQGLMTSFGATLQRVERGEVEIAMPWSDGVTQQHGFFHGGVVGALADSGRQAQISR